MTQDILLSTTMEYIVESKKHLELAVAIETAMPLIRNGAIENVLERVEKHLSDQFDVRSWEIELLRGKGGQPQCVRIRNESWANKFVHKYEEEWRGVRLVANNGTGWSNPNISVSPFKDMETSVIKELFRKNKIGVPEAWVDIVYCRFRGALKDWEEAEFIFAAWNESDRLADQLSYRLAVLAREIDDLLRTNSAQSEA